MKTNIENNNFTFEQEVIEGERKLAYLNQLKERYSGKTDQRVKMSSVVEVDNSFFIKESLAGQVERKHINDTLKIFSHKKSVDEIRDFIMTCEDNVVFEPYTAEEVEAKQPKAFEPVIPHSVKERPSLASRIWGGTKKVVSNVRNFVGSFFKSRERFF